MTLPVRLPMDLKEESQSACAVRLEQYIVVFKASSRSRRSVRPLRSAQEAGAYGGRPGGGGGDDGGGDAGGGGKEGGGDGGGGAGQSTKLSNFTEQLAGIPASVRSA